jgi:hypothetical protein
MTLIVIHTIGSNDWTIANLTWMDMEGHGRGIIYSTITEFAWVDWENSRKHPGWITGIPGEIRTECKSEALPLHSSTRSMELWFGDQT